DRHVGAASGDLDDDDRRVDVVAVGGILERHAGTERCREIEIGERGGELVAIRLACLLERPDQRHHAVVAEPRERRRLLLRRSPPAGGTRRCMWRRRLFARPSPRWGSAPARGSPPSPPPFGPPQYPGPGTGPTPGTTRSSSPASRICDVPLMPSPVAPAT